MFLLKMAKGYHERTEKNPFAGGPKPTVWPSGIGGRGNMSTVSVPMLAKRPTREFAETYVKVLTKSLTIDEALKEIRDIMVKDLENK
ncbi:MAG: hypothetical protein DRR16_23200 [Candidatus Parabeggiatoa sp. nov. 3]|nr:MAG: hypothetical protein DRR00_18765 [Gammaproteobacteria bacterium]RKZ60733.1 MAG: hypothetical protein DRQ99_21605 [Gammaproteobacteria bacterium]RKZ80822.1 MAG: hypothetical protein DRR16_23200 [Gammaproteobacteria bacterium]HEW97086.1 hypothetical protein [Beggiatoa sp.]